MKHFWLLPFRIFCLEPVWILLVIKCLASFLKKDGWPFPPKPKEYDMKFCNQFRQLFTVQKGSQWSLVFTEIKKNVFHIFSFHKKVQLKVSWTFDYRDPPWSRWSGQRRTQNLLGSISKLNPAKVSHPGPGNEDLCGSKGSQQ